MIDAHLIGVSAIALATARKSGVPGNTSPSIAARLALTASFIQGIDHCETAISEDPILLNEIIYRKVSDEAHAASLMPIYNDAIAGFLYGLHIAMINLLAVEIGILYGEMYSEYLDAREMKLVVNSFSILKKRGWLKVAEVAASTARKSEGHTEKGGGT